MMAPGSPHVRGENRAGSANYAIIDVTKGSKSKGKILALLDEERVTQEIASELRRRGCNVVVRAVYNAEGRRSAPPGGGRASSVALQDVTT